MNPILVVFSVYQGAITFLVIPMQIKEQDRQIAYERNVGIIPDPNAQMAAENEEEMAQEGQPVDLAGGQVPQDDMDLSGDPTQQMPPEIMQQLAGG